MPTDDPSSVTNIIGLFGKNPNLTHGEPDPELIEYLEELLERARSGNLRAIAVAQVTSERSLGSGWKGGCDTHDMIAAIAKLSWRFMYEDYLVCEAAQ